MSKGTEMAAWMDPLRLNGRRALVTGAGSGIGRAASMALSSAGAHVVGLDRDHDSVVEAMSGEPARMESLVLDVADHEAIGRVLGDRSFDIVVNAAGIMIRGGLDDTSFEEWNRVLAVNITGAFNILKAVVPNMPDGSSIIQIASIAAHTGYRYPAYSASKGAVLTLTRQLARELGPRRIRVNSISPGVIVTGLNDAHFSDPRNREPALMQTPLGRLGEPLDIAYAVLFLASDMSAFVTGTDVLVDGGLISTAHI